MVGSMERKRTCASACPSCNSGSCDSPRTKSSGLQSPEGRALSKSCRFAVIVLSDDLWLGLASAQPGD
jgi:hypothetical protein